MQKRCFLAALIVMCLILAAAGCKTTSKKPPEPFDPSKLTAADLEKAGDALVPQQGKAAEAVAAYEKALEKGGDVARLKYKQGFVLLREGQWGPSLDRFEQSLSVSPEDVQTLQGAAYAAFKLGDYARAEARLGRAVSVKPDLPGAHNLLGIVHDHLRQPQLAVADFKAAIALSGPNPDLTNNLGIAYFMNRDYARAEDAFRQALAKGPYPRASNNLALALCRQKKFDAAFEAFKLTGGEAVAYNNTGVCLADDGQRAKANEYFHKAIELSPRYYAAAERNLNRAGGQPGEFDAAIEAMTMQTVPAGEIAAPPKVSERSLAPEPKRSEKPETLDASGVLPAEAVAPRTFPEHAPLRAKTAEAAAVNTKDAQAETSAAKAKEAKPGKAATESAPAKTAASAAQAEAKPAPMSVEPAQAPVAPAPVAPAPVQTTPATPAPVPGIPAKAATPEPAPKPAEPAKATQPEPAKTPEAAPQPAPAETKAEPKAEPKADTKAGAELDAKAAPSMEDKPEPAKSPEAAPQPAPAEAKPEAKAASPAELKPEPAKAAKASPEVKTDAKTAPVPAIKTEPAAAPAQPAPEPDKAETPAKPQQAASATEPGPATAPAEAKAEATPQTKPAEGAAGHKGGRITNVSAVDGPTGLSIYITTDTQVEKAEVFAKKSPPAVGIDLFGDWKAPSQTSVPGAEQLVFRLRAGKHPDRLRLMFDLNSDQIERKTTVQVLQNGVVIVFGKKQ